MMILLEIKNVSLIYTRFPRVQYSVHALGEKITYIVQDAMSKGCVIFRSDATKVHYIFFARF